jgi:uncharacterized protein YjiS (DUF1127 family)
MLRSLCAGWAILGQRHASQSLRLPWHRRGLVSRGGAAVRAVLFWMERSRQRRALAELDDRLLRDIGLTRYEARQECANPFWKP